MKRTSISHNMVYTDSYINPTEKIEIQFSEDTASIYYNDVLKSAYIYYKEDLCKIFSFSDIFQVIEFLESGK